jgi:hypothetical protein
MNDTIPPVEQCDVLGKASLAFYRTKAAWWRWLRTDDHHALWPQIYSMLIGDMTFRTLAAAAEADKESALHSPIIKRGLLQGYAATQGLSIRRLVDTTKNVISLQKLLGDIKNNINLLTRENYVSGGGLPYGSDRAMQECFTKSGATGFWAPNTGSMAFVRSMQAHAAFDRLAGTQPESRDRGDIIPKRLIDTNKTWLKAKEIEEVVEWSNMCIAHAADPESYQVNLAALAPIMGKISTAQRHIVRAADAVSAHLLRGAIHGNIVPVFQYSQFVRFEIAVRDPDAVQKAQQCWHQLVKERDQWTQDLWHDLTCKSTR